MISLAFQLFQYPCFSCMHPASASKSGPKVVEMFCFLYPLMYALSIFPGIILLDLAVKIFILRISGQISSDFLLRFFCREITGRCKVFSELFWWIPPLKVLPEFHPAEPSSDFFSENLLWIFSRVSPLNFHLNFSSEVFILTSFY